MLKALDRWIKGDMHGIHYAVSVAIATAVLWASLRPFPDTNPIWAISSMVATSDPLMKTAKTMFRARMTNATVGCVIGLAFIGIGGTRVINLPLAIATAVLVTSYGVRIQTMWRQAPITAAFVISASLQYHSRLHGLQAGAKRMAEVLFGCVVGLVVAWVVSKVWPLPEPASPATASPATSAGVTPPKTPSPVA